MKRFMGMLLAMCLLLTASARMEEGLFEKVCPADEALALSKAGEVVVMEGMRCTSGQAVWDAFVQNTAAGRPAEVLCAHYYVLDPAYVSPELYAEEKDDYPRLFFYRLAFDGEKYAVVTRRSSEKEADMTKEFLFLRRFTGEAPRTALYSRYEYYVLVDQQVESWEEIMAGLFSSRLGDLIEHCAVYQNTWEDAQ